MVPFNYLVLSKPISFWSVFEWYLCYYFVEKFLVCLKDWSTAYKVSLFSSDIQWFVILLDSENNFSGIESKTTIIICLFKILLDEYSIWFNENIRTNKGQCAYCIGEKIEKQNSNAKTAMNIHYL